MHIPDGYLSPATCLTLGGLMIPVWYKATAVVRQTVDVARIPFMAMGAVFVFLIMMFNIPVPNGTTVHAAGGVLLALALGPWTAVMAVSVALFIQALVFGDGGMLAYAANAFNIAFLMPFAGYYTYRLVANNAPPGSGRALLAAGLAGYVGINAAALATAVEFGIQPLLYMTADGMPIYCPYGLEVAIPAMMLAHLTIAGCVEGAVTAAALKFVWKKSPEMVATPAGEGK